MENCHKCMFTEESDFIRLPWCPAVYINVNIFFRIVYNYYFVTVKHDKTSWNRLAPTPARRLRTVACITVYVTNNFWVLKLQSIYIPRYCDRMSTIRQFKRCSPNLINYYFQALSSRYCQLNKQFVIFIDVLSYLTRPPMQMQRT